MIETKSVIPFQDRIIVLNFVIPLCYDIHTAGFLLKLNQKQYNNVITFNTMWLVVNLSFWLCILVSAYDI